VERGASKYLDAGCLGLSFGIRYIPELGYDELITIFEALIKDKRHDLPLS